MTTGAVVAGLEALIAGTARAEPGAAQRLAAALGSQLASALRAAPPGRRGDVVRDMFAAVRAAIAKLPARAPATPLLLIAADAVRASIAATGSALFDHAGSARMPHTALELAAQGALAQLDQADRVLTALEREDQTLARVARLRFYAGLDLQEIGAVLGLSNTSVRRAWNRVRTRLRC